MNPYLNRPAILIVDGQWESTFLLQRLIRSTNVNHPVHTASGAQHAIELLRLCVSHDNPKPILILLDVGTPQNSGFDVLQWLREHQDFKNVTVVMLAATENSSERKQARELGAQGYLLKYPSSQTLAEVIKLAAPPMDESRVMPGSQPDQDRSVGHAFFP